ADGCGGVCRILAARARQVDEHFHGTRLARVASQVAAQLELPELVGDAGERLQPDGVADLSHARRITVPRDRGLDDLEDRQLLRAEVLAPTGARSLRAGDGDVAHGCSFVRFHGAGVR